MKTLLAFLLILIALPAHAAQCWKPADIEQIMTERWNERVRNIGVTDGGALVRFYLNPKTGTWTLTIIRGKDRECVLSAGENWQEIPGDDT